MQINGGMFRQQIDPDKPEADAPKVRYFGPGVYRDQIITVKSNETIYLDEGCILYGQIYSGMAQHFTIAGHGILCGSIYDRYEDTLPPVNLSNCSDFTIRDITILDPSAWTVNLYKCHDAQIENVKIISARSNSDGFTFQSCQNLLVRNCFVRSWDDSLVVKNYDRSSENITFTDCILWTDLAQSMEIGYETNKGKKEGAYIKGVSFNNITVLNNFHKPVISVHNADDALISDILFEDITVEHEEVGSGDGSEMPYLIDINIASSSNWSSTKERGKIDGVTVKNVQFLSGNECESRVSGFDGEHMAENIVFENVTMFGEKIKNAEDMKLTGKEGTVRNITWK